MEWYVKKVNPPLDKACRVRLMLGIWQGDEFSDVKVVSFSLWVSGDGDPRFVQIMANTPKPILLNCS